MSRRTLVAFCAVGLLALPLRAQFWDSLINPDVSVTLTHPPALGIKVQRVAFAPVHNPMAQDLIAACIADLSAGGQIEVLDRSNIERVLNEQKFANSGMIDESSAVAMGKLLGSPVLIFVKVPRFDVKRIPLASTVAGWTDNKGGYHPSVTTFTSKTQADFNASVQAVDLATGRIYSQQRIVLNPSKELSSTQGRPEFPSDTEVIEIAMGQATAQVHQMLLPWTEQRKLIFYDDKDYGMKAAYKRLQLNDGPGALQKSLEALEAAKADNAKPKYIGRTNYNIGMCQFIMGDYASALPYLRAARETDPTHKIFAGAETECLNAISLSDEMSRVDARSAKVEFEGASTPAAKQPKGASAEERLQKLESLRKKGLVTPAEYKTKKAEIMKNL
jgi:hypothetical protein